MAGKNRRVIFQRNRTELLKKEHFIMHVHTEYEILFILSGRAQYRVESSVYEVNSGDVMIMRPGEVHSLVPLPDSPVYERLIVYVDEGILKETLNGKLLDPFDKRPAGVGNHYPAGSVSPELARACFDRLQRDTGNYSDMRSLAYVLPLLQDLYDCWLRQTAFHNSQAISPLAEQLIGYINEHLFELTGVQQLEETFFLSHTQVSRIFRSFTGTSVWNYVQIKRLFAARELLHQGIRAQEAAVRCGYRDYTTFYRAYKKFFGHGPGEDGKPTYKK